jgi:hypothetical protein
MTHEDYAKLICEQQTKQGVRPSHPSELKNLTLEQMAAKLNRLTERAGGATDMPQDYSRHV